MQVEINYKKNLVFLCVILLFVSCASSPPPRIKGYPRPYRVLGEWYQPIPSAKGFRQTGRASWYGDKFHGKKTANGEIYNMHSLTAAHKTLPLGTWLHVENLENGKTVEVRVNDRGPFVGKRIIDLSYKAAVEIGMTGNGTARVRLKTIDKNEKKKSVAATVQATTGMIYSAQAGSFSSKENAEGFMAALDKVYRDVHLVSDKGIYKIRIGKFSQRSDAEKTKDALKNAGYSAFIVQERL